MPIFCFVPREQLADNMHSGPESRTKGRVKIANMIRSQPLSKCVLGEEEQDSAFLNGGILSVEGRHSHTFF